MKKILIGLTAVLLTLGIAVNASDLVIDSKNQSYAESENKIKFQGDVKVSVDDLRVEGQTADVNMTEDQQLDTATFYDKPYAYEVKKNKKREVKANILKVSLITKVIKAEGDTQSIVYDGKNPIVVINADSQEYDTNSGVMDADGTVNESFADKFVYDPATEILIATGNTTSKATMEGGDKLVLKSNYQEYNKSKNIYNASGNVHVWYQDYYAVGPKITFYPDKTTGKPNEIYFTGRSSITQGVRTIYADKIRMTLEPKDFQATGNTRTVIKNIGSGNTEDSGMSLGL